MTLIQLQALIAAFLGFFSCAFPHRTPRVGASENVASAYRPYVKGEILNIANDQHLEGVLQHHPPRFMERYASNNNADPAFTRYPTSNERDNAQSERFTPMTNYRGFGRRNFKKRKTDAPFLLHDDLTGTPEPPRWLTDIRAAAREGRFRSQDDYEDLAYNIGTDKRKEDGRVFISLPKHMQTREMGYEGPESNGEKEIRPTTQRQGGYFQSNIANVGSPKRARGNEMLKRGEYYETSDKNEKETRQGMSNMMTILPNLPPELEVMPMVLEADNTMYRIGKVKENESNREKIDNPKHSVQDVSKDQRKSEKVAVATIDSGSDMVNNMEKQVHVSSEDATSSQRKSVLSQESKKDNKGDINAQGETSYTVIEEATNEQPGLTPEMRTGGEEYQRILLPDVTKEMENNVPDDENEKHLDKNATDNTNGDEKGKQGISRFQRHHQQYSVDSNGNTFLTHGSQELDNTSPEHAAFERQGFGAPRHIPEKRRLGTLERDMQRNHQIPADRFLAGAREPQNGDEEERLGRLTEERPRQMNDDSPPGVDFEHLKRRLIAELKYPQTINRGPKHFLFRPHLLRRGGPLHDLSNENEQRMSDGHPKRSSSQLRPGVSDRDAMDSKIHGNSMQGGPMLHMNPLPLPARIHAEKISGMIPQNELAKHGEPQTANVRLPPPQLTSALDVNFRRHAENIEGYWNRVPRPLTRHGEQLIAPVDPNIQPLKRRNHVSWYSNDKETRHFPMVAERDPGAPREHRPPPSLPRPRSHFRESVGVQARRRLENTRSQPPGLNFERPHPPVRVKGIHEVHARPRENAEPRPPAFPAGFTDENAPLNDHPFPRQIFLKDEQPVATWGPIEKANNVSGGISQPKDRLDFLEGADDGVEGNDEKEGGARWGPTKRAEGDLPKGTQKDRTTKGESLSTEDIFLKPIEETDEKAALIKSNLIPKIDELDLAYCDAYGKRTYMVNLCRTCAVHGATTGFSCPRSTILSRKGEVFPHSDPLCFWACSFMGKPVARPCPQRRHFDQRIGQCIKHL